MLCFFLGLVSVINPLDRETNSEFTLLVVATDSGGRSGTGTVLVTVTDANTQNPVFSTSLYQAIISENSPVDTSVLQVRHIPFSRTTIHIVPHVST